MEEDELLELDDELDDELELLLDDELDVVVPLQLAACGLLPVICKLSIFAKPPLVVACKRMRWLPLVKLTVADAVLQVVHAPVPGKLTLETTVLPSTITDPVRFELAPLAKRQVKV